ncbi:MAG: 50S ribosomal protein L2 [Gammaproteobacteria bacterium]|nr:MAG: 50S ribosomal protein L2 [Gammaproteobacteria bacterium]
MANQIIKSKPTSAGRRFRSWVSRDGLSKDAPVKSLLESKKQRSGRNNKGRITSRHRGGGHKKHYRIIDFKRDKDSVKAKVERLEYDPNRTANIALVLYEDGERRYIVAPENLNVGDLIESGSSSPISIGNCLPLSSMPLGTVVHCIEMFPGKGAQIARSAGSSAQILAIEGRYTTIRLRSGEVRKVLSDCRATIGAVSNSEHALRSVGKAGAKRWLGRRPKVRGVAMNPIDHPHGGGEGKTSGGRHPVSPWGVPTKGFRTRKKKKKNSLIVRRRYQ